MRVSVLASGSGGNATYVETSKVKLLIDLGTTALYATKMLNSFGVDAKDIKAIFLTHTHSDHVEGLKVFLKRYNPTLYLTKEMHNHLSSKINISNYCIISKNINLGDLEIKIIKTSHDVPSVGYIIKNEEKELVYITDTGYLNSKYYKLLENKHIYIIESNHDPEMVMNSSYPFEIQQRILSDKGHLSNRDCAYHLSKLIGNNTEHIILAHLSEENNTPTLAHNTLLETFKERGIKFDNIVIATQKERTELIEV